MLPIQMSFVRHRILHIGGSPTGARTVREALVGSNSEHYEVEWARALSDGLERLTMNRMSAVLLDLPLPDGSGIEALETLLRTAPTIPVIVVGADENEEVARLVVRAGAHDYLLTNRRDA
jgi:DNA-binding response OmpR family regulator